MSYEKRVGQRMAAGDVPVRWHLAEGKPPRSKSRMRAAEGPEPAYLRNVSATGAAIVAPRDERLMRGASVRVEVGDGADFMGLIRRVVETDTPEWVYYGLTFTEETPGLQDWLRQLMEHSRGDIVTEVDWRTSY